MPVIYSIEKNALIASASPIMPFLGAFSILFGKNCKLYLKKKITETDPVRTVA